MPRGGARKGAGRKPKSNKNQNIQTFFEDAESYLEAVVSGLVEPDPLRIQAAKCLIRYQKKLARTPLKSPTAGQLVDKEVKSIEAERLKEFEERASIVRQKYREGMQ